MQHAQITKTKEILKKLISYDVLGGQSNLEIIQYITSILDAHKVDYHFVPNENNTKKSLFCRIGPAVDGGLILSGHTDVVPVEGQEWHSGPFEMIEKDGKLFGRGSCDMKGFLACCLASIDNMKSRVLTKPIYFAFSYDEEIGCLAGPALAEAIKNTYTERPEFAIIGEPSNMRPVIGQKGICVLETTVKGSAGHSSRIMQEVSAVHVAAKIIIWLETKMEKLSTTGNKNERFSPSHTTLHCGMVKGGIAPNVIADTCTFYWDIRVIPEDDVFVIIDEFISYTKELESELKLKYSETEINTRINHPPVPPLGTSEDSEIVSLIQKITGNNALSTVSYAAEAGQFANEGFKTVICGPGDIAQAHRANEFIEISQLEACLKMLENLVDTFSETNNGITKR